MQNIMINPNDAYVQTCVRLETPNVGKNDGRKLSDDDDDDDGVGDGVDVDVDAVVLVTVAAPLVSETVASVCAGFSFTGRSTKSVV